MPKTRKESLVFTALMVFFMVFCMTVYTISLGSGGLRYGVFAAAIKEMWAEYAVVFLLIYFVISKAALAVAFRIAPPQMGNPMFTTLAVQCCTVMMIVPAVTLFATFFHNGFSGQWFVQWVTLIVQCFPMALVLQIFAVGPLVRKIFRTIFRGENAEN